MVYRVTVKNTIMRGKRKVSLIKYCDVAIKAITPKKIMKKLINIFIKN